MRTFIFLSYIFIGLCLVLALSSIVSGCSTEQNTENSALLETQKIRLMSEIKTLNKMHFEVRQNVLLATKEELVIKQRILNENEKHFVELENQLEKYKTEVYDLKQQKAILLGLTSKEVYNFMLLKMELDRSNR